MTPAQRKAIQDAADLLASLNFFEGADEREARRIERALRLMLKKRGGK